MSKLSSNELEKGLKKLEEQARSPSRRQALLAKAADGSINSEENEELVKSLTGGSLAASATDNLHRSDEISKGVDASDFLRDITMATERGLETLAKAIEAEQGDSRKFNMGVAQVLLEQGKTILAMDKRLETMAKSLEVAAAQPARAPRSVGATQQAEPMLKSAVGQPAAPEGGTQSHAGFSRTQLSDAMSLMLEKGVQTVAGEDLLTVATKFDGPDALISKSALSDVVVWMKANKAA